MTSTYAATEVKLNKFSPFGQEFADNLGWKMYYAYLSEAAKCSPIGYIKGAPKVPEGLKRKLSLTLSLYFITINYQIY